MGQRIIASNIKLKIGLLPWLKRESAQNAKLIRMKAALKGYVENVR